MTIVDRKTCSHPDVTIAPHQCGQCGVPMVCIDGDTWLPVDSLARGKLIASRVFEKRTPKSGVRKGMKNVEAHLSESELAVICAAAYQLGFENAAKVIGGKR